MLLLIISISAAISNLVIGLFIVKKNKKSATNRLFFIMNVVIAIWSMVNYFSLYPWLGIEQIVWVRLVLFCAVPLTYLYFLLIHTFPAEKMHLSSRVIKGTLVVTVVAMLCTLTPFVFQDMPVAYEKFQPIPGALMPVFAVAVTAFIGAGVYLLIKKYRAARHKLRLQLQFLLYGTAIMFALILATVFYPSIFLHNSTFAPYASLYTFIFAGATAIAIVKHRLFDIQAVVARSVTYSLLIAAVLIIYTAVVFGLSQVLPQKELGSYQVIVYGVLAVFVAGTFQPLKKWLENKTDLIFYKNRYSTNALLADLSKAISSTLDSEQLAQSVLDKVVETVHIVKGAVYVENKESGYLLLAANNFDPEADIDREYFKDLFALESTLNIENEEGNRFNRSLAAKGITVVCPFASEHTIKGILLFGNKQSGDSYTNQDIQLLEILGPELAVAIENALSYQQVQKFNTTLQMEVAKATEQLLAANEQLSRKNHQLEELDKLKDEFISVTSHELRTPLTAIRGYLWMVIHGKKDANYKLYMDRAYTSSERLIDLVNDTLDISRIESGRVQLNPQPCNLHSLAKQVIDELQPRANEKKQKLTIKAAPKLPAALCDIDKIHQVLINLVGNALKFTPDKGAITLSFYTDKNHIVTSITDDGPGISEADQKRLFQKFSRLEATIAMPGTGLGLYLCQQIIGLSKGKIWIDSLVGHGATFFFSLPISLEQPSILPSGRQSFSHNNGKKSTK